MQQKSPYIIRLTGLAEGKVNEYDFHLSSDFFASMENTDVLGADLNAAVDIEYKRGLYFIAIGMDGTLTLPCDRCLDPLIHPVDTDYVLIVKHGPEYDDSTDGVLVIPESQTELDLAPLLYDTALLTIPMRLVHEPGACNPAMEELISPDDEPEDNDDSLENDFPNNN